jgi:AraC family transcriptional regulator of adaptative response/methylated-DNA-[protein]-cysteine methyltransferase
LGKAGGIVAAPHTPEGTMAAPSMMMITTDDNRWEAIERRDARHDGEFVYAVATTGVYCRPSCPSRRPLRPNVAFFATPADAAAAGYRPCKRCGTGTSVAAAAVERARRYLDSHAGDRVTLDELAREAGLSPHHLQRTFKATLGVSPRQYAAALRADRLKDELRRGSSVSRATFEAGYGASSRAYEAADAHLGMTPAEYRRGGRGTRIRFATRDTELGRLLVAATDRGVCSVTLGDDDAALERDLAGEFPNADIQRAGLGTSGGADADLRSWLDAVAAHIAGRGDLDVPTDASGTPFQQRVWSALRQIPRGETRSYTDVAVAVGAPRAVRAVASACARNRIALVVPCHRVLRGDGGLGGYRWGVERKRALLERERARPD